MQRQNSRNNDREKSQQSQQWFNMTQGGDQYFDSKGGPSRQIGQSDLFKASTQKQEILQLVQNELNVPDESLTISSFSQSPYHGRMQKDFIKTQGARSRATEEEERIDRGGLEGTYNDTNKTSTVKSLSYTGGPHDQNYMDDEDDDENQNISQDDQSYFSQDRINNEMSGNIKDNMNITSEDLLDEDVSGYESGGGRDSPHFNRLEKNEDLTVSHTLMTNATYRGIENPTTTRRGVSNRTFADSVIKQGHIKTSSTNKNKTGLKENVNRRGGYYKNDDGTNQTTDDNMHSDDYSIEERDEESMEESKCDTSEISGIESLTNTYMSKMTSKQFKKVKGVDLTDDNVSSISPNVQRLQEESLDYTPSKTPTSQDKFNMNSYLTNKLSIANRTVSSDQSNNPLNKLTTLPKALRRQNYNTAAALSSGRHNSSLQRDPELEEALEEPSISQEMISEQEYKKLRIQISQLEVQKQKGEATIQTQDADIQEKERHLQHLFNENHELLSRANELQEHVDLISQKSKGQNSLQQLRDKALQAARSEIKSLNKTVLQDNQIIQELRQELQRKEFEDQNQVTIMSNEINKLCGEIQNLKIKLQSKEKKIKELQESDQYQKQQSDNSILGLRQSYEKKIEAQSRELKEFNKVMRGYEEQLKVRAGEINQHLHIIGQKDKIIDDLEEQKIKVQTDLRGFKERCKDYERELEQTKNIENISMFGNSMNMGAGAGSNITQTQKKFDFEVKQMREMYNQQLTKAKEEISKIKGNCQEKESKIQKFEEENRKKLQQSMVDMSDKFDKDQELINELNKVKQQLNGYKQLEQDLKDCFGIGEREDLLQRMVDVRVEIETVEQLNQQLIKLQRQLSDMFEREKQNQLSGNQDSQNKNQEGQASSNFTKNLLLKKDTELNKINEQFKNEVEIKKRIEEEKWKLEETIISLEKEMKSLHKQIEEQMKNIDKTKEGKDQAERNSQELKEKLRQMIRDQSERDKANDKQSKPQNTLDEVERKKYEELINMIMELDLATDPLHTVNLSLQNSYIDEFEQASKHLEDQKQLVQNLIQHLQKENNSQIEQIETLKGKIDDKQGDIDQVRREIQRINEINKEREKEMQVMQLEQSEMTRVLEKKNKQLIEVEQISMKLKNENEEAKNDMRKLMRTQEHLFKEQKKPIGQKQATVKESDSSKQDLDRVMMVYEDQVSRLYQQIDNLSKSSKKQSHYVEEGHGLRDLYRNEVFEMLDKLIDSRTKMPTFNDLAVQLSARIEKVRNQEKLKASTNQSLHQKDDQKDINFLKSSKATSENQLVETFKQEMDSINNEEELLQSINKFFRQSQGSKNQKPVFQNFFQNEDNTSLMQFSELMQNQQQKPLKQQSNIESEQLKQELQTKEQQVQSLQEKLQSLEHERQIQFEKLNSELKDARKNMLSQDSNIMESQELIQTIQQRYNELQEEVKMKDQHMRQSEEHFNQLIKERDDDQKVKQRKFNLELEQLKEQVRIELSQRSQKLDQEYDEMETQRKLMREQYDRQTKDLESKYQSKCETQENEFRERIIKMEQDIRSGCEKNKEEVVTSLYKELEDQYLNKLKIIKEDNIAQAAQLKQEHLRQLEEIKRQKEREMKRMKEEAERQKKNYEDKAKKSESESLSDKETIEYEYKGKIEQLVQKQKKDIKTACDKVRAEMRNQVDTVKNEMAKIKAEYEREKKRLLQENESEIEKVKREMEDLQELELKKLKDKLDKAMKKKVDDKDKEYQCKMEELDLEMKKIGEIHKEQLKKEKERIENRLKEQVRSEVKQEVQGELEEEFQQEFEKLKNKQQMELDKLRTRYEQQIREEVAATLPRQKQQKTVEIQCNQEIEQQQYEDQHFNQNNQSVNQSEYSQMSQSQAYIEQLKINFEEELERQQQVFEVQLVCKQASSVRIFEEILVLEFDKILQSIYFKSTPNGNQAELEQKRKTINQLVSDMLVRNDDRKERQMKTSLEIIKKKISEVLKLFKQELEQKVERRNKAEIDMLRKQQTQSEIMSNEEMGGFSQASISGNEVKSECSVSNIPTQLPTPRGQQEDQKSFFLQQEFDQYINKGQEQNQQRSDIKKYIEFTEEGDEVLKKLAPVPNSKGVLVVEVDKIVRDLKMLQSTIKQSKFYRVLMSSEEQFSDQVEVHDEERGNSEMSAQVYRQLLNDYFRMIVKLNNGVENLGKQQEVYKLKLLNAELKEQLNKMKQESELQRKALQVEEILNYYNGSRLTQLSNESQQVVQMLEYTQFLINKSQFKLYQLLDLFTVTANNNEIVNKNAYAINQKCKEFVNQQPNFSQDILNQQQQLLQSQCSPSKGSMITPEMLSPEETAQLIVNIFQRFNQEQLFQSNQGPHSNQQQDTYQSIFQTFLSNDEYQRSAENFIQRLRDHQQFNQTQKLAPRNLPLQTSKDHYNTQYIQQAKPQNLSQLNQYQSIQSCPQMQMNKKRSRSQAQDDKQNVSCQLPYVSQNIPNIFQSNLVEKQSTRSNKPPKAVHDSQSTYTNLNNHHNEGITQPRGGQQHSIFGTSNNQNSFKNMSISQQSAYSQKPSAINIEELSNAQSNVNALFQKLKLNLQPGQSQDDSYSK